jgi:uncharacterized protein YceK
MKTVILGIVLCMAGCASVPRNEATVETVKQGNVQSVVVTLPSVGINTGVGIK